MKLEAFLKDTVTLRQLCMEIALILTLIHQITKEESHKEEPRKEKNCFLCIKIRSSDCKPYTEAGLRR